MLLLALAVDAMYVHKLMIRLLAGKLTLRAGAPEAVHLMMVAMLLSIPADLLADLIDGGA